MDDFRSMLQNIVNLELTFDLEPNKSISMKSELVEILSATKIAIAVPIYNGRRVPLEVGRRLRIFFKREDMGVCNFHGLVVSRQLDNGNPVLLVQMVSNIDKNQRRDYYRLQLVTDVIFRESMGVTLEKQVDNGKIIEVEVPAYKDHAVLTKDISGGGLRAAVGERFTLGQIITVVIPIEKDKIEVSGEIVRCQLFDEQLHRYDCGVKFLDLDEKDRSRIISFIFEKQRGLRKKGLV